jgi:type I restriction enzyme M protein
MFNLWKTDEETKTAYSWASSFIYGIEKDYRLAKTTKVSCFLNGDGEAKILYADGLNAFNHEDYKGLIEKEKFDVVVANPPFSVEDFKSTLENGNNDFTLFKENGSDDIECLFMERTAQLLKEGGIVAVILPSTVLTNEGIHAKARKLFVLNFEIIAFQELFSTVFAATGNSTTVIFGRKRKSTDVISIERLINEFYETKKDFNYNGNKAIINSFCKKAGIDFEEYTQNLDEKQKEKLKFFALAFNQKCLVSTYESGSGNGRKEKLFLGYEHSARKKYEGIHPFPSNSSGKINSKLYTEDESLDVKKVSYYIYKTFLGEDIKEIEEGLRENIMPCNFDDLINWNEENFNCYINTLESKKSQQENVKWKYESSKFKSLITKEAQYGGGGKNWNVSYDKTDIRYLRITDIKENGDLKDSNIEYIKCENENNIKDWMLENEDILIARSGSTGRMFFAENLNYKIFFAGYLVRLKFDKSKVLPKFIYVFSKTKYYWNQILANAKSTTISNFNARKIEDLKIPLPPMKIQEQIVSEIEEMEKLQRNVERDWKL